MALVWVDGFEGYGNSNAATPAPAGVLADKYRYVNNESQMLIFNSTANVMDDWALRLTNGLHDMIFTTQDVVTDGKATAGIGMFIWDAGEFASGHQWPILCFKDSSAQPCVELRMSTSGTFYIVDASNNYVVGVPVMQRQQEYQYVELQAESGSTANVEVRLNGATLWSGTVNTDAGGGNITRVCIGEVGVQGYPFEYGRVDNFYVCDGTGNTNNSFLGMTTIKTLWPDGDDTVNWTTTANSANHYENVNRLRRDGSTDYVEESGSGVLDLFTFDDLSANMDTIRGVAVLAAAEYDTTNAGLQLVLSSNGSTSNSGNVAITTDVLFHCTPMHIVEQDPDTGNAWTNSAINALKAGFRTP